MSFRERTRQRIVVRDWGRCWICFGPEGDIFTVWPSVHTDWNLAAVHGSCIDETTVVIESPVSLPRARPSRWG
jgi:hypothetical protein